MVEIIRRSKSQRAVRLPYGEAEQKIIRFLGRQPHISLHEISEITGLNRYLASRKIIRLVLSNVLRVIPTEKGDLFFRT